MPNFPLPSMPYIRYIARYRSSFKAEIIMFSRLLAGEFQIRFFDRFAIAISVCRRAFL